MKMINKIFAVIYPVAQMVLGMVAFAVSLTHPGWITGVVFMCFVVVMFNAVSQMRKALDDFEKQGDE